MSPIEHIRRIIFKSSQAAFADIAGTTQATVSRWETGELEPGREEMAKIREHAMLLGEWNDRWFFEVPADPQPASAA